MPPPPPVGGGIKGSPFATAAKVLFDSAQKSGAVKPLESSNKMYAHQLKKIQNQSKRRGGSLGGVSYRVAEFLAAQRNPAPAADPPLRPNARTTLRKVPLLDIPIVRPKSADGEATAALSAAKSPDVAEQTPPLNIPLMTRPSDRRPPTTVGRREVETESVTAKETPLDVEVSVPEILITEDKPMFDFRAPQAPAVAEVLTAAVKSVPTPAGALGEASLAGSGAERTRARKDTPGEMPIIGSSVADSHIAAPSTAAAAAPVAEDVSVESWEQQREKELARLQRKKEDEERRRMAALLEEKHRELGIKWTEARTVISPGIPPATEEGRLAHKIALTTSLDDALGLFQKLLALGSRSASQVASAAWILTQKMVRAGISPERFAQQDRFLEMLEKSAAPALTKSRIKLRLAYRDDLITQYHAMDAEARKRLDRSQVRRLVGVLAINGHWEEAIALVEESRTYLNDRSGVIERRLLSAARLLDAGPRAEAVSYITRSLNSTGRLGIEAKLELALMESSWNRRNSLTQLAASSEADERVYAELLKRTPSEKVEALLAEMSKRGLNAEDPLVLEAVALRKVGNDNPMDVFREIERQIPLIGVRPSHMRTAALAVRMNPTAEVLDGAVQLVRQAPEVQSVYMLRKLLPFLYANERYRDIVEIADAMGKNIPIPRVLPIAVAIVNEAMLKVGRAPLSKVMMKDVNIALPEAGAAGGFAGRRRDADKHRGGIAAGDAAPAETAGASSGVTTGDLTLITEKMLTYAKEKQWAQALRVVTALTDVPAEDLSGNSNAAAVTLVYNCALSAAVENAEVVLSVHNLMKERGVSVNPTTVNTVLSSLSKSSRWEEAVPFFEGTTHQQRDMNTYLVMVSLLGKHSRWVSAVAVFDEMRKANPKPPSTMYAVAISATANASWADTLRIFQDMLKVHGASVKDNVVNQVIRCLEQNGRAADVAKLEKEIQKRRKKKK